MSFDPDKYIADKQKTKTSFDPDAYLSQPKSDVKQAGPMISPSGLLESTVSQAPELGMMSGGLAGAAYGTAVMPGIGTAIGGILGAGAGGLLGSAAQSSARLAQGENVSREDYYGGMAKAAGEGAKSEVIGGALGKGVKVIGKGLKTLGKQTALAGSRLNKKAVNTYYRRAKQVDKIIKEFDGNIDEAAAEFKEGLTKSLRTAQRGASEAVGEALQKPKYQNALIKTDGFVRKLQKMKDQVNQVTNPGDIAVIDDMIEKLNTLAPEGRISLRHLHDLKQYAYDIAEGSYLKSGQIMPVGKSGQKVAKAFATSARERINKAAPEIASMNNKLSKMHKISRDLPRSVLDPTKSASRLMSIGRGSAPEQAKMLQEAGELIDDPQLLQKVEDLYAARTFADPDIISGSFTGRSVVPGLLGGAIGEVATGSMGAGAIAGTAASSPLLQKQAIRTGSAMAPGLRRMAPGAGLIYELGQRKAGQEISRKDLEGLMTVLRGE